VTTTGAGFLISTVVSSAFLVQEIAVKSRIKK
jgi:hypothetical protein